MCGNNITQKRQALISQVSGSVYDEHHCLVAEGFCSFDDPRMVVATPLGIKCSECNRDTYVLYLVLLYDILAQMQLQVYFVFIEYTDF
jgi:hypothetical protein